MRTRAQRETDFLEAMENTRKYFDGATKDDLRYMALYDFSDRYFPNFGDSSDVSQWIIIVGINEDRVKQRMIEIEGYPACREQVDLLVEELCQALYGETFVTVASEGKFTRIARVLSGILK